jgi:hypothetical protein
MGLVLSTLGTLTDLCVATAMFSAFAVLVPLLVVCSGVLMAGRGSRREAKLDHGSEENNAAGLAALLLLFLSKGMVLWILLMQGSAQVGGPASVWACAVVLEKAADMHDPALLKVIDPPPGGLDYVFLLLIAPLLCAPVSMVSGLSAAWHAYLCCAFFWRSRAPAAVALALSAVAQLFSWSVGVFAWRRWLSAFGVPATSHLSDELSDVLLLLPAVGVVLLLPARPRRYVMLCACALSPACRDSCRDVGEWALRHLAGALSALSHALPALVHEASSRAPSHPAPPTDGAGSGSQQCGLDAACASGEAPAPPFRSVAVEQHSGPPLTSSGGHVSQS